MASHSSSTAAAVKFAAYKRRVKELGDAADFVRARTVVGALAVICETVLEVFICSLDHVNSLSPIVKLGDIDDIAQLLLFVLVGLIVLVVLDLIVLV